MFSIGKRFLYSLFLTLFVVSLSAAQFQLPVKNFDLNSIGASNQNWGVTKADDGMVYVANSMGLLRYDGLVWNLFELPNKTVIRSVLAVGDKIYSGSYEEFGYWQSDEFGNLNYHSLVAYIDLNFIKNQEIWNIKVLGDTIYFQSFGHLFSYNENGITVIDVPSLLISIDVVEDQLYLSTQSDGVFTLNDGQPTLVVDADVLHQSNIISVSKRESKLFITTSLHGSFTYDKKEGLLPFNTEINDYIKSDLLNNFSVLTDGRMIFGTIKNGVYITSSQGTVLFHINRGNSLDNNTVLNHASFDDHSLWIALDNGLSEVYLDQPTYFEDKTGQLGVVYAVVEFEGALFLGSNTGLFYLQNEQLHFVEGSQGQVWFLKVIDGTLICGHNSGTFIASQHQFKRISSFSGGWTLKPFPNNSDEYVLGTYIGLEHLKKTNGVWSSKRMGDAVMPFRYVEFESPKVIWAAHAYKGLYRVYLRDDGTFDRMVSYADKGITSPYTIKIVNLNGGIRFKTNTGWMKYDAVLDQLIDDELLNSAIGTDSDVLYSEANGTQVGIKTKEGIFIKEHILDSIKFSVINPIIQKKVLIGKELLTKVNSKTIINIVDGFSYVNLFKPLPQLHAPQLQRLVVANQPVALDSRVQLPYGTNSISFHFTAPKNENYSYQYRLNTNDTWKPLATNVLNLENLKERFYTLEYRVVNSNSNTSAIRYFEFEVLPPWYQTLWGYLFLSLLILLLVVVVYSYQRIKIKRKELQIKAEFDQKQQKLIREKELETQQQLLEHKAELLQNEIKLKSKRLADSAMELGKKNEAFQNLRDEILHHRDYISNEYWLKKMIRQINKEIEDNDQWALFEKNFNQVHEEFFHKLSKINSKLTPKDLKLCAYIKMNLSNKEIAPLMNITVRGVETHRFRLKKKLNLDQETIFEFIKSL